MNAISILHSLEQLNPESQAQVIEFIEFVKSRQSNQSQWAWLDQFEPFDDAFCQAIATQPQHQMPSMQDVFQ